MIFSVLTGCLAVFAWAANAEVENKPIWLVVTKPAFTEAIKPLAEHRARDGFETMISTSSVAQAIGSLDRRPAFLLLVGDDEPGQEEQVWYLPAKRLKKYRWQSNQSQRFASDALWGDLDGDLVPEMPVGRIPARNASEVSQVVNKIIAFENKPPSLNDLGLSAWGGAAGYDPVIDRLASMLMLQVVRTKVPLWVSPWIICADPTSPFCGWPADQSAMFTEQLKRGGVLAVLIGHAESQYFYAMTFMGQGFWYSARETGRALASGEPGPPLVMLCCLAGNFAADKQCLAESLLMMGGGPAAVIAATTESHPLTNYFSSVCLVQSLDSPDQRLGELWLSAQKKSLESRDLIIESMLSNVEGKLEDKIDVDKLRRDQMLMYALLGDPALRMRLPEKLHGKIKHQEDGWHWKVHKPEDATELHVGLRAAGQELPVVAGDLQRDTAGENFRSANATLGFRPLPGRDASQEWEGVINNQGILRLVAIGPKRIYVAALNLRLPEAQRVTAAKE